MMDLEVGSTNKTKCHNPDDKLNFKSGNPGSVRYGNFINYYKFHPSEKRISLLPEDVWSDVQNENSCCVLDVGCNAGELTLAIYNFLSEKIKISHLNVLGIDIDPILIERAKKQENLPKSNIKFLCVDIMDDKEWTKIYSQYLIKHKNDKFSIAFCFSVTMWIHLNHGDLGLKKFLKFISENSKILVIEPQPWKCYLTAKKRLRLSNENFSEFEKIKIRQHVEEEIENYLKNECNCKKLKETNRTEWGRKLLFFKC